MKSPLSHRLLPLGTVASLLLTSLSSPAADRHWVGTASVNNFNNGSNYSPTGALVGTDYLIFDIATDPTLTVSTHISIGGIEIRQGANGFRLQSAAQNLVIGSAGIAIAANTNATIDNLVNFYSTATDVTMSVGTGGSLTLDKTITPYGGKLTKSGAGTLIINAGFGAASENRVRTGSALLINEGTLIFGDSAYLSPASNSTFTGTYNITLGTTTTSATLRGGGVMAGTSVKPVVLTTAGSARSFIAPSGDGTLEIQNLNASAGATFAFDLGTSLLSGSGTFTGSTAAGGLHFDFSGGSTGVSYTLLNYTTFSGVDITDFLVLNDSYVVDQWSINNGNLSVTFSAVPEPSTALLLAGALGGVAFHRFRRRNRVS